MTREIYKNVGLMCRGVQIFVMVVWMSFSLLAQQTDFVGSRSAGVGHASVCLRDVWACINNEAGLSGINRFEVAAYAENRYLIKDLDFIALSIAIPSSLGTLGLSILSIGTTGYYETKAGISYGKKFGKTFSAGIQINYYQFSFQENKENDHQLSCHLSINTEINSHLLISSRITNPVSFFQKKENYEPLQPKFSLGSKVNFSENFIWLLQLDKDLEQYFNLKTGFEYNPIKQLSLRVGVFTNPFCYSFGIGLFMGRFSIDCGSIFHQQLGISPSISLKYSSKAKK